jgi:hypothetical protein
LGTRRSNFKVTMKCSSVGAMFQAVELAGKASW